MGALIALTLLTCALVAAIAVLVACGLLGLLLWTLLRLMPNGTEETL